MKWIPSILILALLGSPLAGCAPSASGKVYSREQSRVTYEVFFGTILQLEAVSIEGTQSGAGTLGGGALGAALGSGVGSGSGRAIAVVGGAIAGALAGSAVEKNVTTKPGYEIMVELENGTILAIVQEQDQVFAVGQRVRVLKGSNGITRVRP